MILYGCGMTSPETIRDYLTSVGKSFAILPFGIKLADFNSTKSSAARKQLRLSEFVLIQNYTDFRNNLKFLKSRTFPIKAILFAPVIQFRKIDGVHMLDVETLEVSLTKTFRFSPINFSQLQKTLPEIVVNINEEDYASVLIDTALEGSILAKMMTLIYKIPNSKVQNEYRDRIVRWFVRGDDKISTVATAIADLPDKKVQVLLLEIIEKYKHYKDVFKLIASHNKKKKKISFEKICEKYKVSEFDLRYMLNIAEGVAD